MNHSRFWLGNATLLLALAAIPAPALAKQPLETENARLPEQGHGSVQGAFEYLTDSEGTEIGLPLLIEYGVTDRLRLTIEPKTYQSFNPKVGKGPHGIGDVEVIATYLLAEEDGGRPALALAGEIKLPTAKSPDLGTGKADFRVFGIASKRSGKFDFHLNAGYTFIGSPKDEKLPNVIDYAVAAEFDASPKLTLTAEVFGETAVGKSSPVAVGGEAPGGTVLTGGLGVIYKISDRLHFTFSATYDTESALIFKPGLTFRF